MRTISEVFALSLHLFSSSLFFLPGRVLNTRLDPATDDRDDERHRHDDKDGDQRDAHHGMAVPFAQRVDDVGRLERGVPEGDDVVGC